MQYLPNVMENSVPSAFSFNLTNVTNRQPKTDAEVKKDVQNRIQKLVSQQHRCDPHAENRDINRPVPAGDLDPLQKQTGSENAQPENPPRNICPGVRRTLKKVNMDFFRGKKVQFRQANVRISFEIVDQIL